MFSFLNFLGVAPCHIPTSLEIRGGLSSSPRKPSSCPGVNLLTNCYRAQVVNIAWMSLIFMQLRLFNHLNVFAKIWAWTIVSYSVDRLCLCFPCISFFKVSFFQLLSNSWFFFNCCDSYWVGLYILQEVSTYESLSFVLVRRLFSSFPNSYSKDYIRLQRICERFGLLTIVSYSGDWLW